MKFACTRCGSRYWPDPDGSCPLCNDGREELTEALGDHLEAQEQAIRRFVADGCKEYSASHWWKQIDEQTDEKQTPETMAERLAWLHTEACREAWQDLEKSPSSFAWNDACAIAGFDLCKNYRKTNQ
jgi:predicted DCC family thiol-disulfide oxidoreductase YuxK